MTTAATTEDEVGWRVASSGTLPRHVAIIMDGNGRWAHARGLPRVEGHRRGVDAVRRTVRAAIEIGIPYLTIFSFSSENWRRPAEEIGDLMGIFKRFVRRDLAELHQNGVRVRMIGERQARDREVIGLIEEAETLTRDNDTLDLIVAFNYGSRDEIVRAARRIAADVAKGKLRPEEVCEATIEAALDTAGLPPPDLLIRTSGEQRLSNFLLWQTAYTEFVFLDAFWPEFDKAMLEAAIRQYQQRDRRFGGASARSHA